MIAIRNYTNTTIELRNTQNRLKLLETEAEKVFDKFFPTTASPFAIIKNEKGHAKDKQAEFQIEMDRKRKHNGLSLREEIAQVKNDVRRLKYYVGLMNDDMKKLKGIEYELYYDIVINENNARKSISKIVEEFAEKEGINREVNTIWVNYYPKIEEYLKKLRISSENQVEGVK